MANKPKNTKLAEKDRRARVEAMRREQQAKERRKSTLFVVVAVLVGVGLVAAAAVPAYLKNRNDPKNKSISSFGVSAAAASCSPPSTKAGTNTEALRTHVKDGTVEKYATVPPSYGPHWASPQLSPRAFYTAKDRPAMETLVHNLEHGYTIVWYDATVKGSELKALEDVSAKARTMDETAPGKFFVSAWDPKYGTFPNGKHIGISHWGAQSSTIQLCGKVSGAVVDQFVKKHPSSDAPEPAAA